METSRLMPTVHEPAQTAVHRNSTDPHALWVVWSKVGRTDHPGREGVVEILLRDAPRLLRPIMPEMHDAISQGINHTWLQQWVACSDLHRQDFCRGLREARWRCYEQE